MTLSEISGCLSQLWSSWLPGCKGTIAVMNCESCAEFHAHLFFDTNSSPLAAGYFLAALPGFQRKMEELRPCGVTAKVIQHLVSREQLDAFISVERLEGAKEALLQVFGIDINNSGSQQ